MSFAKHTLGTYGCTMITSNGLNGTRMSGILLLEKNEMELWRSIQVAVYGTIVLQMVRRIIAKCRMPTRESTASSYSALSRNPNLSSNRKPRVLAESIDSKHLEIDSVRCRLDDREVSLPIIRATSLKDLCIDR